jgi:protease-4
VQSSYINREIRRLRAEYPDIPLYAVVEDMCASGGYFVAAAADKIFVNESSVVGSIGVLSSSFGFVDTLEKLGVERRLQTAGEHKGFLDPFSPRSDYEQAHLQKLLDQIHDQFIAAVREGRGDKLADNPELFSGLFWTGEESIRLGLADEIASAGQVARDVIGAEDIVDFTPKEDVFERLAKQLGAGAAKVLSTALGVNAPLGGLH